jgi:hypothetical protein
LDSNKNAEDIEVGRRVVMSNTLKNLFIVGAILTFAGSFLPWQQQGDLISYLTNGISVFPPIQDNGGFLIVLLSMVMILLVFRPFAFIDKPTLWSIVVGVALVLDSVFHIGNLLVIRMNAGGVFGAPTIQIGLVMVSLGSILLLIAASLYHLRQLR